MRHLIIPSLTFYLVNKVYPFTRPIRAPYDNINVTNNNYTMNIEITSYINPYHPTRVYYKATYGRECYHHIDKAIVDAWLKAKHEYRFEQEQKDRLTERAMKSFYNK